jgi:hypothetical protein
MLLQHPASEDCAFYAVANLLRLYGSDVDRDDIAELAGQSSDMDHKTLLDIVNGQVGRRLLRWARLRSFSYDGLSAALDPSFNRNAPSILTFHIRHYAKNWYGLHCVVATHRDAAGIHVLDSLGLRGGKAPNAVIAPQRRAKGWPVVGTPAIILPQSAFIMENLPALPDIWVPP